MQSLEFAGGIENTPQSHRNGICPVVPAERHALCVSPCWMHSKLLLPVPQPLSCTCWDLILAEVARTRFKAKAHDLPVTLHVQHLWGSVTAPEPPSPSNCPLTSANWWSILQVNHSCNPGGTTGWLQHCVGSVWGLCGLTSEDSEPPL